jgi:hypothetical protein
LRTRRSLITLAVRALLAGAALAYALPAEAQLRIVTYNTANDARPGMDVVLKSIGEESYDGFAKPIDILLLQEQSHDAGLPTTQLFVDLLNTIYAGQGITYARGNLAGLGDDTQTIVYRTQTVSLLNETTVGAVASSGMARQALRYQLRPVGYDSSADFYIYNDHYKASEGTDSPGATSNADRRLAEATTIRANADALGQGANIIYVGDFNLYHSDATEPAWAQLTSAGNGQAFDPVNRVGNWHQNSSFADVHTQSPTVASRYGGQVPGGMDDRFDFQLVSGELRDGSGFDYLPGSYHAFGNNGTTYNKDIDDAANSYVFSGVTSYTKSQILSALASVSDHLPVVADYQLPTTGGGTTRQTIAKDTFDATLNRVSFNQTTFSNSSSGFQTYQAHVTPSIPSQLIDQTADGNPGDVLGVVNTATKSDIWFGVTDTVNPNNPSGDATATWVFNVAGAANLQVSVDMGAMGNFEAGGVDADTYTWTYSLDGGAFQPLFTSSVNEAVSATYTLANGTTTQTLDDPLYMTNTASATVQLTNVLQTLTSSIAGAGTQLAVRLFTHTNAIDEAYVFDNLLVTGLVASNPADFNNDGLVNAADLTAWKTNFGLASGATKAQGDANNDGRVDGADFLIWQKALGAGSATAAFAAVPEPTAMALGLSLLAFSFYRPRRYLSRI